jgi:nitrite reductase (NADH) small subunit
MTATGARGSAPNRHAIGVLADFPMGTHKVVDVDGRSIGVFNIEGTLYALPNVCPHQAGPLCEARMLTGTLEATAETEWRAAWVHSGEIISCPWHGLEYHVPTGRCLAFSDIRLRQFTVVVDGETVMVELRARRVPGNV